MWQLDHKESWAPKNWYFWTVVLQKTLESPLDCKEIQPVHPKGNQPWIFIGRTDAEVEDPILWPPDEKSWLIGKDSDAGRDWGQEEKGMTEDEMAGGHHWLDGHEFGWIPGVGDGQVGLACCDSWGCRQSDTTEQLNWTELVILSNHLRPLHLLPSVFPIISIFSSDLALHLRWPKYWIFNFSISPSNEYWRLISFNIDWFDLFAVQGTLKSLLQHHNSKVSILWLSVFFIVQPSHPYRPLEKP